jgi:hypothetical protein
MGGKELVFPVIGFSPFRLIFVVIYALHLFKTRDWRKPEPWGGNIF